MTQEEKINVAELLKDCPSGMELDCTMYEDVYFDYVDELNIIHCYIQHGIHKISLTFNQHGTPNSDIKSKCVIYPKGKTTWKGFQRPFEDGDVVATTDGLWIGITTGGEKGIFIPTYCVIKYDGKFEAYLDKKETWYFQRLATEEEKAKLFDVIKEYQNFECITPYDRNIKLFYSKDDKYHIWIWCNGLCSVFDEHDKCLLSDFDKNMSKIMVDKLNSL